MLRKIVLEDDSFMEEEIVDDYEVLREIRNASWPRDRELHAREPVAPNDLLFTYYGVTGMETFDEDQTSRDRIRPRKPPRN
jgi:hypothetical protein